MSNEAAYAKNDQPIKNGTLVTYCNKTGNYNTRDTYVSNIPELTSFQTKWNNRFHNGILVELINGQEIIGT